MKNKVLGTKESMDLIVQSIQQTKIKLYHQRFYYLFWGWLVLVTSLAHYLLAYYQVVSRPYLVWPITGGLGFLATLSYGFKNSQKTGYVETFLDRTLKHLWIVVGISVFVVIWVVAQAYQSNPMPIISILIGIGTLVSGLQMRFTPLIIGGSSFFVGAIVLLYVTPMEGLLVYDICVILGYLIPGYRLKNETA
ncbi:MAG TPA: hypothetical protein DIT52_00815 [Flavobacteriaceae bacterium]|nr:hypothetical protein [Flavobacteriaceae bacterium]